MIAGLEPPNEATPDFPYRVEAKVGEGGMGAVYRAIEPALNRVVAVKRVRLEMLTGRDPEMAKETRDRFLREARAAAALSHPGVTTIYRVGEDGSGPFIAMEWLDGTSLETLIEEGALSIPRIAQLGAALLETLDAAHAAGVVHRDIKPANITILRDGRLKVMDFGIARVQGGEAFKTQAGVVFASPRFASPEQMMGDEVDGRSDIFSASVTMYLALTGHAPFAGATHMETLRALINQDPRPLREWNASVPPALEAVILKGLRKRREDRFSRAGEMAEALRPFGLAGTGAEETRALPTAAPAASRTSAIRDLPSDTCPMVAALVLGWPDRSLGRLPVRDTLDRLLDRALHVDPFAGVIQFDGILVFAHEGRVVGALDMASGRVGDEVIESLPVQAETSLHSLPADQPPVVVSLLGTLLGRAKVRTDGLESSFVNLPAMAKRLLEDGFEGILRLRRNGAVGLVLLGDGRSLLTMFSTGWDGVPVDEGWETWVGAHSVHARIEEKSVPRLAFEVRRKFKDLDLRIDAAVSPPLVTVPALGNLAISAQTGGPHEDPAMRFLAWSLDHLAAFFAERGRLAGWKYVVDWLPLARRARLHHELPQPDSGRSDYFDLVTFDDEDKALHLMHRVARATARDVRDFVERVSSAKTARKKGGDIGAAFLVSPSFEGAALSAYKEATASGTGQWIEDALTRYEGFVRLGPRRGFHLLLVTERSDRFEPILPS